MGDPISSRAPRPELAQQAGASLADILVVARQLVQAVNNVATTYLQVQGQQNKSGITAAALVRSGAGRICTISVTVAGSATGKAYDCALTTNLLNEIYVIPEAIGLYVVNLPVGIGLVVVPGTGQTLTVSFS